MPTSTSEHPDFVVAVEAFDDTLGRRAIINVGYGYKHRQRGMRIFLAKDARSRQLLYEAETLDLTPLKPEK